MRLGSLPLIALLASSGVASAQVSRVSVDGGAEAARAAWAERVDSALSAEDLEASVRLAEPAGTVAEARLEVIAAIENHVAYARSAASHLEERAALLELAAAESLARANLDVPGMVAWYAEVELAIAMVAAQAGQEALSQTALRRAVTLDPSRELLAAEARPELVRRARAAIRASAVGPRGRFEVRSRTPGAQLWLDDRPLGALPQSLEASVGTHVVRVDAPGHHAWARTVEVYEGARAALEVVLSPSPGLTAARAAVEAGREGQAEAVQAALGPLETTTLWMLQVSERADRALAQGCRASGCGAPLRLELGRPLELRLAPGAGSLASEAGWLRVPSTRGAGPDPEAPWWQSPWLWTAIGAAVLLAAGGVALGVVLSEPQGPPPLIVDILPGAL